MKIAILGNLKPGYICPMTKGLARMLAELQIEATVFSHGLNLLQRSSGIKEVFKQAGFRPYISRMAGFDAIIVIQHLRDAFRTSLRVEQLRRHLPDTPILLYDLTYLPTVGRWGPWLEPSGPEHWGTGAETYRGLDRYDWYLCVSQQNRLPLPVGEQPCTEIGIHLDDGTLFPEQRNSFRALIDFEREAFPGERQLQLDALKETGTDYVVLQGQYPIAEIRAIYRSCSIYFLAHMESFGLPICEVQACGCRVMTPYTDWCDAHRLPESIDGVCDGLPPNFTVYRNDKRMLINEINRLKQSPAPQTVAEQFRKYHGHFLTGNPQALQTTLDRIAAGKITARSHLNYRQMTGKIPPRPEDEHCLI